MNLFIKKDWEMHSGKKSDFKIECDALTDEDIKTIAHLISRKFTFFCVRGIPTGGMRLAYELEKYIGKRKPLIGDKFLIVDDVFTTGASMEKAKEAYSKQHGNKIVGVVIFARGKCPDWIYPIFDMLEWLN
jgi:orotate phosphoribosyltransferase